MENIKEDLIRDVKNRIRRVNIYMRVTEKGRKTIKSKGLLERMKINYFPELEKDVRPWNERAHKV